MTAPATPLVITGIGVASALGLGWRDHWDALVAGKSAIAGWTQDPADPLPVHGGARVDGFNVNPYLADRKMARLLSRSSALGFAASHMALADSKLDLATIPGDRRGLFCQTGMFQVENLPDGALEPFLLIDCPTLLFPFARRLVADLTREGGFPPLLLDPINFANLFVKRQQELAAAQAKPA